MWAADKDSVKGLNPAISEHFINNLRKTQGKIRPAVIVHAEAQFAVLSLSGIPASLFNYITVERIICSALSA